MTSSAYRESTMTVIKMPKDANATIAVARGQPARVLPARAAGLRSPLSNSRGVIALSFFPVRKLL
jgi:hypothetical protein